MSISSVLFLFSVLGASALTAPQIPYTNSVQLTTGYQLDWTVQAQIIYFQLTLQPNGNRCWMGLGVHTAGSPYSGMPNADIAVSLFDDASGKILDVTDSWAPTTSMPSLDTAIAGCTDDIIPGSISGQQDLNTNVTVSRWARALVTPDAKCDNPITAGSLIVIWSHGSSNTFGYHGQNRGLLNLTLVS